MRPRRNRWGPFYGWPEALAFTVSLALGAGLAALAVWWTKR